LVDGCICHNDDMPCGMEIKCVTKVCNSPLTYIVCSRIRFKGSNSVLDRGMGMTLYEKLKRQGLIPK